MSRHLRAVPDAPDEAVYVVARSQLVRSGVPYVIAHCVDRAVAAVFALAGQQVRTRAQMEGDASLAEALAAWESEDHTLFHAERAARASLGRNRVQAQAREVRWHPSRGHLAQP